MSLIVENGSGVSGANSYVDLAYLEEYHALRENLKWDAGPVTEDAQIAAALRAMTYIECFRFKGKKISVLQSCSFPRSDLVTRDGLKWPETLVPEAVRQAQAEGALRELLSPGTLLPDWTPGKGPLRREKLGEMEEEWFKQDPNDGKYPFQSILRLLADFIRDPTADTSKTLYVFDVERT